MSYCKVYLHNVNDSPQSIETAPPGPRRRARAGRSAERESSACAARRHLSFEWCVRVRETESLDYGRKGRTHHSLLTGRGVCEAKP